MLCAAGRRLGLPARLVPDLGNTAMWRDQLASALADAAAAGPNCCAQLRAGCTVSAREAPCAQPATRSLAISRPIDSKAWIRAAPLLAA